ncbi:MAG: hypothetical protein C0506_12925 [Anaerolinea sp.]|nr:hypothetical protein [Anaerolinea sp.]
MLAEIPNLEIDEAALRAFCEKWGVAELAVFGSVLRDDFGPESDIDFLVTFRPNSRHSLLDYPEMEAELSGLVGRPVDLANRAAIEESRNPFWQREILQTARLLFAA